MKKDIRTLAASLPHFLRLLTGKLGLKVAWKRGTVTAMTDLKTVTFEPFYLNDKKSTASLETLISLYYGKAWHEGGHHRHTDMVACTAWRRNNPKIESYFMPIEDARMEAALIKEFPFARADLNSMFDTLTEKGIWGPLGPETPKSQLLKWYVGYRLRDVLRHQPQCRQWADDSEPHLIDAYGGPFVIRLNALLQTQGRSMKTSMDSCLLVEQLIEIAEEEAQDQSTPDQPDQEQNDSDADNNGDGDNGTPSHADDDDDVDSSDGQSQTQGTDDSDDDGDADDNGPDGTAPSNGTGDDPARRQEIAKNLRDAMDDTDEVADMDAAMEQAIADVIEADHDDSANDASNLIAEDFIDEVCEADMFQNKSATQRDHDFTDAALASRQLANSLRVRLESKIRSTSQPQTKGRFDPRRIPRIPMGETRLFTQRHEKKALNTAILILLDTSSSMNTDGRNALSCDALYATVKALAPLPGVSVAAAGFPVGGIIHRFDQKSVPESQAFGINATGYSTPLAQALAGARAMLLRRPEKRKIVVVLTDGEPDNPRAAIHQRLITEHYGIEMYALGIQHRAVKNIFPQWRVIDQLSELTPELLGLLGEQLYQQVA